MSVNCVHISHVYKLVMQHSVQSGDGFDMCTTNIVSLTATRAKQ